MARSIKIALVLAVAGLAIGYGLYGAKPKAPVQVRVSFEGLTTQTQLNDALGPYVSGNGVTAQITGDLGDFVFEIPHHSARSVIVIFPSAQSQLHDMLPQADDPIDYFIMRTYNSFSTMPLNFLTMTPGEPKQVLLWNWVCTETVHSYRILYNRTDPNHDAGIVEVVAYDQNLDGKIERWEITPVPNTGDMAWIIRWSRKEGDLDYGSHPMPFKLIIERL